MKVFLHSPTTLGNLPRERVTGTMNDQDKILMLGLSNRDKRAYAILFETYHAPLFRFAETYVCCPGLAEDIVQEVFIKLWENSSRRISKSIRSYLFLMVRNACIDYLRSVQVEDKKMQKLFEAQIVSDSVDLDIDDHISQKIKEAINELPEQCREVYQMSVFDGLKYSEISEELNISVSSVKVQVYRAKNSLREKLTNLREFLILFSLMHFSKKVY
ncbi:RNA polymerase sigma factor [Ancylomarina salipaludis]|uniref:RNA polymerase sigma factor n=1 Tax=Ancylomarina salipaludis TaxID=2501299 RepID=UPI00100E0312|nr:RNA polymerase sigma-70 factor [Ancylomarina salipaludis]